MVPEVVVLDDTGGDLDEVGVGEDHDEVVGCPEHKTDAVVGPGSDEEAVPGCQGQVEIILGSVGVEHWALIMSIVSDC